jgi:peptide chain release factor subunit 1
MRGNGTTLITLQISQGSQISQYMKKLIDEQSKAPNIKLKSTRKSVQDALSSAIEKLKLYKKTPENGLIIFCGYIVENGNEKLFKIDLEPIKPLKQSFYYCDNRFHVNELKEMLESKEKYGFIIMDGNGTLFGILQGNQRKVLGRYMVDLPKKHSKGGQSAPRFQRIRQNCRHLYVSKISEMATSYFIENDKINVSGFILAGSADFKYMLNDDMLDPRLANRVLGTIDINYGGLNGFNQAIDKSKDIINITTYVKEQEVMKLFFDEIAKDGNYVFGINDTFEALIDSYIHTLIINENVDFTILFLKDSEKEILEIVIGKYNSKTYFKKGIEYDVQRSEIFLEWLLENYKKYVNQLHIVSDQSSLGVQFAKGFSGIGGILRYKIENNYFYEDHTDELNDDFI